MTPTHTQPPRAPIGALCKYCGCPCGGEYVTADARPGPLGGTLTTYTHLTATACLVARQRAERVWFNREATQ
jgi:hypothetical protein